MAGLPDLPSALQPEVRTAALNPRRLAIVKARKRLSIAERRYAHCLIEGRGNLREAEKRFRELGYDQSASTLSRWRGKPYFRHYVDLVNEEALAAAGVTAEKVLLTTDALSDYGSETIVKRNKYGQVVADENGEPLREMRDPHLALKANEFLGRHFRLWGDDDRDRRVVVNIVDLTGSRRVRTEPLEHDDGEARPT
jgi:hypothetical protein